MTSKDNLETSDMEARPDGTGGTGEPVELAVPTDPAAQLEADVEAARKEAAEWQDRFLRKAAEMENFRKRVDRERGEVRLLAQSTLLAEFLPVADACERALKAFASGAGGAGSLDHYREGVELLHRQLLDTFSRAGAVAMETEGKPFDPHLHEALSRQETTEHEEGTVVAELLKGYLLRDKLLRPAQVIVAARPRAEGTINP